MIQKSNGAVAEKPAEAAEAQTPAAPVARKLDTGTNGRDDRKARDFDAEARGKVACVAFNAALASPGIAGLPFTNIDEYLALVKKAADASVAYTWEKQK